MYALVHGPDFRFGGSLSVVERKMPVGTGAVQDSLTPVVARPLHLFVVRVHEVARRKTQLVHEVR